MLLRLRRRRRLRLLWLSGVLLRLSWRRLLLRSRQRLCTAVQATQGPASGVQPRKCTARRLQLACACSWAPGSTAGRLSWRCSPPCHGAECIDVLCGSCCCARCGCGHLTQLIAFCSHARQLLLQALNLFVPLQGSSQ